MKDYFKKDLKYKKYTDSRWVKKFIKEANPDLIIFIKGKKYLTQEGVKYCKIKSKINNQIHNNSGVYIIQYPWNLKMIKIGWSQNIDIRYKNYNTVFCNE